MVNFPTDRVQETDNSEQRGNNYRNTKKEKSAGLADNRGRGKGEGEAI